MRRPGAGLGQFPAQPRQLVLAGGELAAQPLQFLGPLAQGGLDAGPQLALQVEQQSPQLAHLFGQPLGAGVVRRRRRGAVGGHQPSLDRGRSGWVGASRRRIIPRV